MCSAGLTELRAPLFNFIIPYAIGIIVMP